MAFRRDLTINSVSSKYTKLKTPEPKQDIKNEKGKKPEVNDGTNKDEGIDEDETKSNYLLTLTQSVVQSKESVLHDESVFEPISQVINIWYHLTLCRRKNNSVVHTTSIYRPFYSL